MDKSNEGCYCMIIVGDLLNYKIIAIDFYDNGIECYEAPY